MTYRDERQLLEGCVEVGFVDGSDLMLRRHEYDRLVTMLQERKEVFVEVEVFFGDPAILRLDHVARVLLHTPDGIIAHDKYQAAQAKHEQVMGE